MINIILNLLYKNKALEIKLIKINDKYNITDYVIVASGMSIKHIKYVSQNVMRELKNSNIFQKIYISGKGTDWIIIDTGDVILHIMSKYTRDLYNIEEIWER